MLYPTPTVGSTLKYNPQSSDPGVLHLNRKELCQRVRSYQKLFAQLQCNLYISDWRIDVIAEDFVFSRKW